MYAVCRRGGGRGGVGAAVGDRDRRADGQGQEAAAGRRVHAHGGFAGDGREHLRSCYSLEITASISTTDVQAVANYGGV